MDKNVIRKDFVDENGELEEIIIESDNDVEVKHDDSYVIANNMRSKPKVRVRKNSAFNSDIGFRSEGFAQIATLAGIVALTGVVVAFLLLRF